MFTVRQVLSRGFPRTWQEAVAIVQESASLLQPGLALPDPEDLILSDTGTLSFGFGSETTQHPVTGLATLLKDLLEGVDAPESLVELAMSNSQEKPALTSIDAFARALSFFERPNRANDLRAVTSRLRGVPVQEEKSSIDLEFERLREKVAGPPVPEAGEEKGEKKPEQPAKRRQIPKLTRLQQQMVAGGMIALVLLALFAAKGAPVSSLRSTYDRAELKLSGAISGVLDHFLVSQSAAAAPAASAPVANTAARAASEPLEKPAAATKPPSAVGKNAPVAHRSNSAAAPSTVATKHAPPAPLAESTTDSPRPGLPSRSLSPTTVRTEPAELSPVVSPIAPAVPVLPNVKPAAAVRPPDGIYSTETPGVNPPVLTRPQMPQEPKPGDDTGYFDMIVDERGLVEQVKLISPRRRYHDRMLVAAAKAWQFKPAMLDGQPVKYRILVPIILSGLPY